MKDVKQNTAISNSTSKHRARFRLAGVIVLLLGLSGAGGLYWIRTRAADPMDDPMMAGYAKPEMRQMEMLYGKMGQITLDLMDDLRRPGTQAILTAAISIALALVCFFLANRWVAHGDAGVPGEMDPTDAQMD
jgi:hypothetical protein